MHARVSRFVGLPPERIDRTLEQFEEDELPKLENQDGFRGVLVLVNRADGMANAITFWDSESNLRASEQAGADARAAAVKTAEPSREPRVDRFQVVLHKEVEAETSA
ncbi:MAG: hypothetical protein E6G56_06735 [Actinobacteria bacterium]|nr:MAG: hypothetical protein E6G56_06735 [Actinomycetota bacterium]